MELQEVLAEHGLQCREGRDADFFQSFVEMIEANTEEFIESSLSDDFIESSGESV